MKLKPYCIKCGCGNGYFRGLYDPYVLALLTEDADPFVIDKTSGSAGDNLTVALTYWR
jgi:hypothetical protein